MNFYTKKLNKLAKLKESRISDTSGTSNFNLQASRNLSLFNPFTAGMKSLQLGHLSHRHKFT